MGFCQFVFVGFGFHHANLTRLVEGGCLDGKKRVFATSYGLDGETIKKITIIAGNMNMYAEAAVQFQKRLNWL